MLQQRNFTIGKFMSSGHNYYNGSTMSVNFVAGETKYQDSHFLPTDTDSHIHSTQGEGLESFSEFQTH